MRDREIKAKKNREISVTKKLLLMMLSVVLLQGALFLAALFLQGGPSHFREFACQSMGDMVNSRTTQLKNRLQSSSRDVAQFAAEIDEKLTSFCGDVGVSLTALGDDEDISQEAIGYIADDLITMLHQTKMTGSFLILGKGEEGEQSVNYPGFYIRDLDPVMNTSTGDILVERGSGDIAASLGLALDSRWTARFRLENDQTGAFFFQPSDAARKYQNYKSSALGYWSLPFRLNKDESKIITYSVPLLDKEHNVYGVLGIEMTEDYMREQMPGSEIVSDKSGIYSLAVTDRRRREFTPLVYSETPAEELGPLIVFSEDSYADRVYDVQDSMYFACEGSLDLYERESPFYGTRWCLLGLSQEKSLFRASNSLILSVSVAFCIAITAGILGVIHNSYSFTKPIMELSKRIKNSSERERLVLEPTHIKEIDQLEQAVTEMNQRVRENASKLSTIVDLVNLPLGAIEYDSASQWVFCTKQAYELLDMKMVVHYDSYILRDDFMDFLMNNNLMELLEDGRILDYKERAASGGEERWLRFRTIEANKRILITVLDVTREIQEKRKLEYERDYDILTLLLNHRAFKERVRGCLRDEQVTKGAMVMWDLDNLKYVNDHYGHDYGDRYIQEAARIFAELISLKAVVGRISGDEFMAFVPLTSDKKQFVELIYELKRKLNHTELVLPNGDKIPIRASAGISWYPEDGKSYEELKKYADFAMYDTKSTMKGSVKQFDRKAFERDAILFEGREDLNQLIENGKINYVFQPIVSTQTGRAEAFEALMRPQFKSLQTPYDVMRVATAQSKLMEIERLTFQNALQEYKEQRQAFGDRKIFINSIPNQIISKEVYQELREQYGDYFRNIVMEIIESEQSDPACMDLKREWAEDFGGGIAIDDYGAGYSSETTLLYMMPTYVKVDMGIVRGISKDEDRQKLVKNLLSYTKARGIYVIAEGVETYQDMKTLIELGVDYLQGFYLGVPQKQVMDISAETSRKIRYIAFQKNTEA